MAGYPCNTMPDNQIGEEVKETPAQPLEEVKVEEPKAPQEQTNEDKEAVKKQEQLQNLKDRKSVV